MINRYAELLLLIGRCVERADHYARIININYSMRHELMEDEQGYAWQRLKAAVDYNNEPHLPANEWTVLHDLTFDRTNPESIFSSIQQVRNHIRTLRPMLPGELWDIMNTLYLWLKDQDVSKLMLQSPYLFYKRISESLALFNGAADATMVRGQNWNFIQTGKFVERLNGTVRLIHATYRNMQQDVKLLDDELRYNRFLILLKSCGGYEAFRKYHAHHVRLTEVTEFLLLNAEFPRSVRFGINSLASYIETNPLLHHSIKTISIQTSDVLSSIRAGKQRFGENITEEVLLLLQQLQQTANDLGLLFAEICFREETPITVEV
ncbi:alpha-E domain-containing protein [Paenibacillus glycanilyticus]|uniref:alpha-E domain-containing protein n=1 Tax=Paenibacillus glycanilyticus TaxID=126569 RepID=UPI00203DD5D0|nr:alpha-E domain-containing protein [Paenibacillus glycanilyticus]MCM3627780.1 alpha-E domain-containing protein [Paenibacillus glycanilyticus]